MKLYNVKDVKGLLNAVNNCEGRVEMVLPSKNINLNNNTEMTEILCGIMPEEGIREIELKTETREDIYKLLHFAMRGEETKMIKSELGLKKSVRRTA